MHTCILRAFLGILNQCLLLQSSTYEVVFEADFNCFYNQTDVNLPDISDQNAVLNDTVFLDAQIKTSSSNPGADSQVRL